MCFDKKENDENIYIEKWWKGCYSFVPMNEKLKQELFWLQARVSRNRLEIWPGCQSLSINSLEQNLGIAIFKKNSSKENFIQFSYRYDWTVTDITSRQHKILIIPNLGRTGVEGMWKARQTVGGIDCWKPN